MPIAFIFDTFPSLSETFLRREVEALRALGLGVQPFAWRAGEGARPLPVASGLASRLERRVRGEEWWRRQGAKWARECRASGLEISHIHAAWASFPAAWAHGAAREMQVPWSFSAHARDLWVEGGDLRSKLEGASFATACTLAGAARLREIAPEPRKVLYAPHGLPLGEWPLRAPRLYDPARPFQLLSVGRLVPKKGLEALVDALHLWRSQAPHEAWRATIIGDGPQRAALENASQALGLADRIHFAGAQGSASVRAAMQSADVFVLPCTVARDGDRDGLPNVLLEAAATGVPLLVGDAGGVRDLCDDSPASRTASLFPADEPEALKGLLRRAWAGLQREGSEFERAAARARAKVERDFDIERNIATLAQALASAGR